ncbi:hypothetical protein [Candidatus Thalassolituus haligoni]|uniref:hypothetical protein n=1 Tax=Candidatus Thalassolituus haligoni TaxID=3100113 RepID=UPI0035188F01
MTILSLSLQTEIEAAMASAIDIQKIDNTQGVGPSLPDALGRKYPNAFRQPAWMFLFPSSGLCLHPDTGVTCRHHLHQDVEILIRFADRSFLTREITLIWLFSE